jgi:hypothetical protein
MKKYRWLLVLAILAATGIWLWQTQKQARDVSIPAHQTKAATLSPRTAEIKNPSIKVTIERIRLSNKQRLSEEALRLIENVRATVKNSDMLRFHDTIDEILYRYKGDPNPLILELIDLLDHKNTFVRICMADVLLSINLETEKAKQTMIIIIRADAPIIGPEEKTGGLEDEFPPLDLRIMVANTIALYGIKEAADDVWNLYQKTKSKELVEPLRRLNDPRIIEELRADAVKNLGTIENMKLIGEYRFAEALPELKRRYEDKNSNADVHFRTLYPLWRITGDEKYFDEFAASFLPTNIPLPYLANGGEREHQYLIEMMKTATSDQLYGAAMALYLRFNDHETIKKTIIGYYRDVRGANWGDMVLARRLVGSINDAELTRVAEEYEAKYPTDNFNRDTIYRKNWSYAREAASLFMN